MTVMYEERDRQREKEKNRYALAAAGELAHGEPVIGLKLNLTMNGATRNGHFIHTPDTAELSTEHL